MSAPEFMVNVHHTTRCEVHVQTRRRLPRTFPFRGVALQAWLVRWSARPSALRICWIILAATALSGRISGMPVELVTIDARDKPPTIAPPSYHSGTLISRSGHAIGINSRYLTMDERPWLPIMGEFHYSRVAEAEWEEELLKMKSAGVQIVSTYVIWIHHEEMEGQFEWSGRRNLRRFVELCGRHGLLVIVRIGPWAHGEARNGGFPDWLLKQGPTRRNDPTYMASVGRFYAQIGAQLKGLLWKDDGPVIGVQLENEYAARGPSQGEEHIIALKKLAIGSGMDVPLYTVTGWDNAVVPRAEVLPVFGGYPDAPWDGSTSALPPNEVYLFRFRSVAGNIGEGALSEADPAETPFLTAELGGGVQDTYHRRPVIESDDVAAIAPVMLGSGANLYGSYMFHGGQNPDGLLTSLQESQATGYPTDVPSKSYDFQAPLGEFGEERESFRKLKVFQYFLSDFGSDLAPMLVHAPARIPRTPNDLSVLRASVRSIGTRGFLFVNNYLRGSVMPIRRETQFQVVLPGSELRIPEKPIDIPSGAYFVWPFNLPIGRATLKYATAQLFTRIHARDEETYVFTEVPGIPAEFVIRNQQGLTVEADGALVRSIGSESSVSKIVAGFDHGIRLRSSTGAAIRLILLPLHEAEDTWRASIDGSIHLVETQQDFFADDESFVLESEGDARCAFTVYPALEHALAVADGNLDSQFMSGVKHYTGSVPEIHPRLELKKIQDPGTVSPVKRGPSLSWRSQGVAMAPEDAAFALSAKWSISLPRSLQSSTVSNVFLRIAYTGDVAHLSLRGKLVEDNFYNGLPWTIGLRHLLPDTEDRTLELSILPLRRDAPIFLESRFRPEFPGTDQVVELKQAALVPQYRFLIQRAQK
ncbi:glycoside hydrolase [Acidobacteria bacterium AB60]|nr:glycoside hydrolase [Acidobacteria bacterium AB60]